MKVRMRDQNLGAQKLFVTMVILVSIMLGLSNVDGPLTEELVPGVDYVSGEVIITFKETHLPIENRVSLDTASFGIVELDSVLRHHGARRLKRFLPAYDECESGDGKKLARTYVLKYENDVDAEQFAGLLSGLPYFEDVRVNLKLTKVYHGLRMSHP